MTLIRRDPAPDFDERELAALEAGAHALDTIAAELLGIATSRTPEDLDLSRLADGCTAHATVLRQIAHRTENWFGGFSKEHEID